jgi:two-component system, chemotaxis family, chemotaxis protein CheY
VRLLILLVEDDDEIRESLSDLLRSEGYDVEQARDGVEALHVLNHGNRPPCLLLLDLMMPNLNGWQLLEIMRGDDRLLTIPVVIMTAAQDEKVPSGTRYVRKPAAFDTILAAVQEHCAAC